MLVWVYTCQNATLLEIICRGTFKSTEKHVLSGHSKIDKTKVLMANCSFMLT